MSISVPDSNEAPAPIAEIVLVIIPFSSVIISIVTLLPAVNLSCFVSYSADKSNCVISPIAEIILEIIPITSYSTYICYHINCYIFTCC